MKKKEYKNYAKNFERKTPIFKNCTWAFFAGGTICTIGQIILNTFKFIGYNETEGRTLVSVILIFLSCLFTGIGFFDKLAKKAGAGTLVPITGFANAMCSPAIDNKAEGFVLGVGAKMFTIAGPVIVYGTVTSAVYGIIYWVITLIK